ncbi:Glycosyl hydrolase family protein with chitinase insertion domain [Striga hermonthica]|uniref:Glycosyl hydrolase family protein with chitinase insertion domain n=1 Tax=Striga hermonthica TaxID=68872 RepID=A0A9N7N018_STRHE|nr:Glycosyl hydrolase family protein with chitinase insertion domain [Striga hermonthica]
MAATIDALICTTAFLLLTLTAPSPSHATRHRSPPIKGIYYPSWARWTLPPSSIDTTLFTHVFYAFLTPNPLTFEFDNIPPSDALFITNFTSELRPHVQTLFSVGGASEGPSLFSRMASAPSSRAAFIRSSIRTARELGFHGIDLDWEFPQNAADMDNLSALLDEWRAAVRAEAGPGRAPLLLTAAVYYAADGFLSGAPRVYPARSVARNLDFVNVMNYDYRGGWDTSATGAHAALFDPRSNVSTSRGLGSWVRAGVPRGKVVMGMPLYGRTWRLRDPAVASGIGAPAVGVGPGEGVLRYAEVVEFNRERRARVVYDRETVSVYSVAGSDWVGYDDVRSVRVKVGYARGMGLGGYFFWAANGDYQWTISRAASQLWSS